MDNLRRLAHGLHDLLQVLVLQQTAALPSQLCQLGLEIPQFDGVGGSIQDALALKDGDIMALLRGLSDGSIHRQHSGISLLEGVIQVLELAEGGL